MTTKRTVPVTILGQEYKVRGESDPETVRRAATLLDETMARVKKKSGTVDTVDIAVLAALNIANHLVTLRDDQRSQASAPSDQLDDLLALLEGVVDAPLPGARAV